jgi:hypothetical protein
MPLRTLRARFLEGALDDRRIGPRQFEGRVKRAAWDNDDIIGFSSREMGRERFAWRSTDGAAIG